MKFGERLKRVMDLTGTKKDALADCLDISVHDVSDWADGDEVPSAEILSKVAECCNCSVDVFLSDEELRNYEESVSEGEDSICVIAKFLPEIYAYLKKRKKTSIPSIQKAIKTSYSFAGFIYDVLVDMGIVDNSNPEQGGIVVRDKVELLLSYMK